MPTYWTTNWSTTSTSTTSYGYNMSKLYNIWNINDIKIQENKIDKCKIEDDELLDLIRNDD